MKTFYRIPIVAALLTLTASVLTDLLESPPMRWAVSAYNFLIDRAVMTLDYLVPAGPLVASGVGHVPRVSRDTVFLTKGIHRRAQPRNRLGDPDDDAGGDPGDSDDGDDGEDIAMHMRRNC